MSKPLLAMILFWLLMNSTFDMLIAKQTRETMQSIIVINDIQEEVIRKQQEEILEILLYQEEMARLYYQVANVSVNTQLKGNINKASINNIHCILNKLMRPKPQKICPLPMGAK